MPLDLKGMNYDFRERIGSLVEAIQKLAQAVEIALASERGPERVEANKLVEEAKDAAIRAAYEL